MFFRLLRCAFKKPVPQSLTPIHKQVLQFQDYEIPPLKAFNDRIGKALFYRETAFGTSLVYGESVQETEQVPIANIIGNNTAHSWDLRDRKLEKEGITAEMYAWDLAKKIKRGKVLVYQDFPLIYLKGIDKTYFVSGDGRHRIAALKGMIGQPITIPADVKRTVGKLTLKLEIDLSLVTVKDREITYSEEVLLKPATYSNQLIHLEERRRKGLWKGEISSIRSVKEVRGSNEKRVLITWDIFEMSSPWIFALDLAKAEAVYKQTNP